MKSKQFLREFRIFRLTNREAPALATPLNHIGVALSYICGKRVDDWVEYTLNKVDRTLAQGVQLEHKPLWNMFLRDFQLAFTDTTKVQSVHQELLDLKMKPGDLDSYISSFEHLCMRAGWGADDAATIMLFKKGLTNGLHRTVLEKTTPRPDTLCGWFEAARKQYKLWAEIKASLGGSLTKPQSEPPKWRASTSGSGGGTRGNNNVWRYHPWQGVRKEDRMDVDAATLAAITAEEKQKLLKEGRCFNCKKLGHVSRNCPTKTNNNTPNTNHRNHGMTVHTAETTDSKDETDLMEQIGNLTMEERSALMDKMVLKGF